MAQASPSPVGPALPDPVRRRVLVLAAAALGGLSLDDVPAPLQRVQAFAPGRRAHAGARPLTAALERDDAFRARVVADVRASSPELVQALEEGVVSPATDPVEAAAVAYLVRGPHWPSNLERALADLRLHESARSTRQADREAQRLRQALAAAQARVVQVEADAEATRVGLVEELASARRELRRLRSDADRARAQARAAAEQAATAVERAQVEARHALEQAHRADRELGSSQESIRALRRADRQGRSLASSRARLLLDTVVEAAAGLRRELALPPVDALPADLVSDDLEPVAAASAPPRARDDADPAVLSELLSLPRAHLLVDGYNVTKSAYGDLPLSDQRARLLAGLSALQARTRAEITCCFDGAVVEGRIGSTPVRGVRVRFSQPGEIADELIRRLVGAEPAGRVVVVVSSDREVADGVRRAGARAVPSSALVRLLDRG